MCVDFLSVPMHVQSWGVPTNQDAPPMAVVYSMKNCSTKPVLLNIPFFRQPVISLIFQGLLRIVKKVSDTSRPFPIKVFLQERSFEVPEFSVPKKQDSTVVINSTREFFSRFAGKWAINKVQRLTHLHLPRKSNLNF